MTEFELLLLIAFPVIFGLAFGMWEWGYRMGYRSAHNEWSAKMTWYMAQKDKARGDDA